MKLHSAVGFVMAALTILILASGARGDSVGITPTQVSQTATAGSTVTFDATLTNLSSTDTIFLNGDSSTTSSLFLSVNDTPFLTNFPLLLNPSGSSGPFALFKVLIDPTALPGTYDFNSFSILGGLDSSASNTLGTAQFSVTVMRPTTVPEPSALVLLFSGLLGLTVLLKVKR
jgi:hypothetical protein